MAMTTEQKRALAVARARVRAKKKTEDEPKPIRDIGAMIPVGGSPAELGRSMAQQADPQASEARQRFARGLTGELLEGLTLGGLGEIQATGAGIVGAATGQGFTPAFTESLAESERKAGEFRKDFPVTSTAAQIAGSIPTGIAGLGRVAATRFGQALPRFSQILTGGGLGAVSGGLMTEGDIAQRGTGAAVGGLVGTGLGVAGETLPRVTAQAKELLSEGIPLTVGQSFGPFLKSAEALATRVPIVREIVRGAERRAIEGFDRVAIEDALSSINFKMPADKVGRDAIKAADDAINEAYEKAIPASGIANTQPVYKDFDAIVQRNIDLPKTEFDQLRKIFKKALDPALFDEKLAMGGEHTKKALSYLGRKAFELSKSPDENKKQMGRALYNAKQQLTEELIRQNPAAKALLDVNKAFYRFQPVLKASMAAPSQAGVFTPNQLVRGMQNVGKKKAAIGEMPGQRIAESSQALMARDIPDSGTPLAAIAATLAARPAQGALILGTAAPLAGLAYGGPLSQSVTRSLLSSPGAASRLLTKTPVAAGQVGSLLAE